MLSLFFHFEPFLRVFPVRDTWDVRGKLKRNILFYIQHQPFQVFPFRVVNADRVIGGLG